MDTGNGDVPRRCTGEEAEVGWEERQQERVQQQDVLNSHTASAERARLYEDAQRKRSVVREWMIEHNMSPDNFDEWIEELGWVGLLFEFSNFFHVVVLNQQESSRDAFAMVDKWAVNRIESVGDFFSALMNPESHHILDVTQDSELYKNWKAYADAWDSEYKELLYAVDDRRRYDREYDERRRYERELNHSDF